MLHPCPTLPVRGCFASKRKTVETVFFLYTSTVTGMEVQLQRARRYQKNCICSYSFWLSRLAVPYGPRTTKGDAVVRENVIPRRIYDSRNDFYCAEPLKLWKHSWIMRQGRLLNFFRWVIPVVFGFVHAKLYDKYCLWVYNLKLAVISIKKKRRDLIEF